MLAPLYAKWIIVGVVALAFGGWTTTIAVKSYNRGYQHAINDIAAKDAGALKRADDASAALATCDDANGVWDVVIGTCGKGD